MRDVGAKLIPQKTWFVMSNKKLPVGSFLMFRENVLDGLYDSDYFHVPIKQDKAVVLSVARRRGLLFHKYRHDMADVLWEYSERLHLIRAL